MISMNTQQPTTNIQHRTRGALRSLLGALAVGLVLSSVAQQPNTNSAAPAASVSSVPSFDLFNVIQRKNIFDPNRRGWFPNQTNIQRPRIDAFALKGTMSYAKGRFAFFDGTSSDYNKVVEVGGNIAGYTVAEITQDSVMLSASGKEFRMPVGRQVRKQNGSWQMGQPIETNDETNGDETAASTDSAAPPAAANAQMSEVLQRLMKAKEQELKDLK
jgi:hypothetical protein